MAKQTGLGDRLYVDGFNLSGDIGSLGGIGGGNEPLPVTGIDKEAMERLGGLRDGQMEFTAYFNPATDQAHPVLAALPVADRILTYLRGVALGGHAASLLGKQIGYDPSRGDDGSLTFTVNAQANGFGIEWGHNLTAGIHTSTGAEDLDGFDDGAGAATDFGLQAYLQVLAFDGTDADIVLEDSDDDGAGDAYAPITGAAFPTITDVGAHRIETGRTENVKEWIRASITGTYTSIDFVVVVVRNLTEVTF
jgi:hypothetical protein